MTDDATAAHGIDAVTAFLDGEGVGYEVVEHRPRSARRRGARLRRRAARGGQDARPARPRRLPHGRIPASHRLDLHRVRELLGATSHLRLATEAELAHDFPMFDVGAMPPLGADDPDAGGDRRPPALPRADRVRRRRPPALAADRPARPRAPLRAARGEPVRDAAGPEPLPGPAADLDQGARAAAVDDRRDHHDGEDRQPREERGGGRDEPDGRLVDDELVVATEGVDDDERGQQARRRAARRRRSAVAAARGRRARSARRP